MFLKLNIALGVSMLLALNIPVLAKDANPSGMIIDGMKLRNYMARPKLDDSENRLLKDQVLPEARKFWKDSEPSFKVLDTSKGAFTRKGAVQKLVLYQYCGSAPEYTDGIAIIENGKLVAHYGFKGPYLLGVCAPADFTNDGLNAVAIQSWPMHQGFLTGYSTIFKFEKDHVRKFGMFEFWDDNMGAGQSKQHIYAYKIYAVNGKNPQFKREKFSSAKTKWNSNNAKVLYKPKPDNIEYQVIEN